MVFVLVKALSLIPLLPLLIPVGIAYHTISAIVSTHTAFVTFLHLWELACWGPKFIAMVLLTPFIPIMWVTLHPLSVVAKLACDLFLGVLTFFTYPIAYFLMAWHAFRHAHMHLWAVFIGVLKLLNL